MFLIDCDYKYYVEYDIDDEFQGRLIIYGTTTTKTTTNTTTVRTPVSPNHYLGSGSGSGPNDLEEGDDYDGGHYED